MQVKEKKRDSQTLLKLRFESRVVPSNAKKLMNTKMGMKLFEARAGATKGEVLKRELLDTGLAIEINPETHDYKFPLIQVTSDLFSEGGPIATRILLIQLLELTRQKNKKTKELEDH